MRNAVRNAIAWCSWTSTSYARSYPRLARSISTSSSCGRPPTPLLHRCGAGRSRHPGGLRCGCVEKTRLEAFSDGVFAIAITLLVLFFLDANVRGGRLTSELLHLWPAYVAYAISFATIGIIWVNHHAMFRHIAVADRPLLFLNVLFLMPVVFLPFPTALLSEFLRTDDGTAAAVLYGITMSSLAVLFNAVWRYAAWDRRLLKEQVDE